MCKENLVYALTADLNFNTEVLTALIEREYIDPDELMSAPHQVGEVITSEHRNRKIFGVVIKDHINDKVLKKDVTTCLKTFRALTTKLDIHSLGIVRDLALLNPSEWRMLIEQGNSLFKGRKIVILFFKNNLPIPAVETRYKLIKEFHKCSVNGHRGQLRTYDRIATEYYWRNMQADIRAFVRSCPDCQIKKVDRKKTRLPMVITDNPVRVFDKVSCDFIGPIRPNAKGQQYNFLTIKYFNNTR